MFLENKVRPVRRADSVDCLDSRQFGTLNISQQQQQASTACYGDNFSFFLALCLNIVYIWYLLRENNTFFSGTSNGHI
jgi:hypothetical protein